MRDNLLSDFPPAEFEIRAYCADCGQGARVEHGRLAPDPSLRLLKSRLYCRVCGGTACAIRIGWRAAGGFAYSGATAPMDIDQSRFTAPA